MEMDSPGQQGDTKGPNSIMETTGEQLKPGKQLSNTGIKGQMSWRQASEAARQDFWCLKCRREAQWA